VPQGGQEFVHGVHLGTAFAAAGLDLFLCAAALEGDIGWQAPTVPHGQRNGFCTRAPVRAAERQAL